MVRAFGVFLSTLILLAGCSNAFGQESGQGTGKVEIGGFPGGGTFFIGGDDNKEANFNVYTAGAGLTYYLNRSAGLEGEVTGSVGLAQDVVFNNLKVLHIQVPGVWSYFGNVVFFPGGSDGKRFPLYITGGVGAISLKPRAQTKPFGYNSDTIGWQTFISENVGAGIKIFRADSPNWGFRGDYRYIIVNSNSSAPAFFAKSKTRGAHRVYFGLLYTWKR